MKQKAFTLIELLVVVSVIGMLMALLFPALQKAKKQSETVACQANLHKWAMIFQQYTSQHEGRWFHIRLESSELGVAWFRRLRARYEDPNRFDLCPAPTWAGDRYTSLSAYNLNGWLHTVQYPDGTWPAKTVFRWRNVHATRSPGSVPVFLDSYGYSWLWATPFEYDGPPPHEAAFVGEMGAFCVPRHGSFVNGAFMDWSVRRVGLKQLWTLKWHREYDTSGPWTKAGGVRPEDWPEWMRGFKDY